MSGPVCECCGAHLEPKARTWVLPFPDAVLDVPSAERSARVREAEGTLSLDGKRHFRRLRIPLALDDDFSMTYDAWMELAAKPKGLEPGTTVKGTLAVQIPPWTREILDSPVEAKVLPDGALELSGSANEKVARFVTNEFPHGLILGSLPDALR